MGKKKGDDKRKCVGDSKRENRKRREIISRKDKNRRAAVDVEEKIEE